MWILPTFGNAPFAALGADQIAEWRAGLVADGLKRATVNTYLQTAMLAEQSCLRPRIGRSRDFRRPWSPSMRLLAYCSVRCHAVGTSSSSTIG
jgi:hypothetical protein